MTSTDFAKAAAEVGIGRSRAAPRARYAPTARKWRTSARLAVLTFRVHGFALRTTPLLYLQAILWRARGLRIRSRNRMAVLTGQSPQAYALWIERNRLTSPVTAAAERPTRTIWPVIDCRESMTGLERTLQSLERAGFRAGPVLVGGDRSNVQNPHELAGMIAEPRPWLLPMCPGDEVACGSCDAYGIALTQHSEARLIYADDDLIDASGRRHAPHFKPDWNPELFDTHDYISGAAIVCADRESLSNLPHAGWKAALVRAALRDKAAPVHIHQVLHHRVSRPEPRVPSKISSLPRFERRLVSVIIPTRNSCDLLRTCIDGLHRASYAPIETIVIDNGSDDRQTLEYLKQLENEGVTWLRLPGPFNYSALNNAAAKLARGDFLCFLNNDVEMRDSDWLTLLVHQAQREELGAVGARLLYADGTIQHAGVVTGIGGGAGHAHRFQASNDLGYFARAHLPQRVSAVTAACLVVAKGKFLEVGGFDEIDFPVAFNDVDLCLKLNARGWQSFYEPRATLIHHESRSRGSDRSRLNRARFAGELAALKKKWNTDRNRDPYHHPDLSPFCEQFLIAV